MGKGFSHFLSMADCSDALLEQLLRRADFYADLNEKRKPAPQILKGFTLANLFCEDSTRTRMSFDLAARKLGAGVLTLALDSSSVNKGETLEDTLATLAAMGCDAFIVRHKKDNLPADLAKMEKGSVINAGDGVHAHPTQALLDALTLRRHFGSLKGKTIAIIGDIAHSRVARSSLALLPRLGMNVRICGPEALLPDDLAENKHVKIYKNLDEAVKNADAIMALRVQRERMSQSAIPSEKEYFARYGLDERRLALAAPHAVVLHPGPMNRGMEISSRVADGPHSLILKQVANGVAARMAVLEHISGRS